MFFGAKGGLGWGGVGGGATTTFSISHTGGICFSCEFWHDGGHTNKQVVFHTVALPFTRQKKIQGNSNISQCKNNNLLKIL